MGILMPDAPCVHNRALKKPAALFSHRSASRRTQKVRIETSLAAAALDGLFEHPDDFIRHSSI